MALANLPGRESSPEFSTFLRRCRCWLLCGLLAGATPVSAVGHDAALEAAAVGVTVSDTLVVTARSLPDPVAPTPAGLVTRVDLSGESGLRDAAEVLGATAGFQVRRYGGAGSSAVPSLRGSSAAQIRFYLDGMPLNGALNGSFDPALLPLDRFQAVEIHRGVVPGGLAGIGGAGAVNFLSRTGDEGWEFLGRAGSFGQLGGRVLAGGSDPEGARSGQVMVHALRADNDFTFLDHNQTFHRSDDDVVRVRRNSWLEERGAWATGALNGDGLTGRATAGFFRRDGGRPGPIGYESPNASVRYERLDGQVQAGWRDDLVNLQLAAVRNEDTLDDPGGEVGFGPPGTSRAVAQEWTARLAWNPAPMTGKLALQTGVEGRAQRQREWVVDQEEPQRKRNAVSLFAGATLTPAGQRLQIQPVWRWQRTADDFPPVAPFPWLPEPAAQKHTRDDVSTSLGFLWSVVPTKLFWEAHGARTVRLPTWVELFGHRGGIAGNRELQPEDITSVDTAISWRSTGGRFSARLAAFFAETDQKIIFIQNSQRTSQAVNAGRARTRGLELEWTQELPLGFAVAGNLTLQKAEDRSDDAFYHGRQLPFLPDVEGFVRLAQANGPWRPWIEIAAVGANYRDRANTELNKAPARTLWNVGLARDLKPSWLGSAAVVTLLAEVKNMTDNRVYDVEGFPLPGRSWHVAARVRI
jgi:iron complex outermembrane receptor protein